MRDESPDRSREQAIDRSTEKAYLPPASPPRNHGHTVAAWVTVLLVVLGFVVAGLAVMFAMPWLFWVGVGVIVVGVVVGRVLKMLGFGQPNADERRPPRPAGTQA